MIKTNTLFILGAGASAPFEYPTGVKLRYEILFNSGKYEVDIVRALNRYEEDGDDSEPFRRDVNKFKENFSGSGVYSIDSFLEHRTEFMDIGKIYIAKILISCEKDNNLRINTEKNWYMYLFDRMKASFEELSQNKLSFITFNYDRSLEYFLFEAIKKQFDKESEECDKMMRNFPIVHLYGQLDPLPWQVPHGKEYSTTENLIERLRAATINIKLISDEREVEKSEYFQEAYKLIEWADRIFFLGFSFDKTNLKRLNLYSAIDRKQIFATAYGIDKSTLRWIKQYFAGKHQISSMILEEVDALTLLKNRLEIE